MQQLLAGRPCPSTQHCCHRHCRSVRASGDLRQMMDAVRSDLIRNLANMTNRCSTEWQYLVPWHYLIVELCVLQNVRV